MLKVHRTFAHKRLLVINEKLLGRSMEVFFHENCAELTINPFILQLVRTAR